MQSVEVQSRWRSSAEVRALSEGVTLVYGAGWCLSSGVLAGQAPARHPNVGCVRYDHQIQGQWVIHLVCEVLVASLVAYPDFAPRALDERS